VAWCRLRGGGQPMSSSARARAEAESETAARGVAW
jgi:hypothetical protein